MRAFAKILAMCMLIISLCACTNTTPPPDGSAQPTLELREVPTVKIATYNGGGYVGSQAQWTKIANGVNAALAQEGYGYSNFVVDEPF